MTDTVDENPDALAAGAELSVEDQMAAAMAAEMMADQGDQGDQTQAYQPDDVAAMTPEPVATPAGDLNLEAILDIPVKVSVEIGRTQVPIRDLMGYNPGSVVELARLVGEPLDVLVNGTLVAKGEVVIVNEKFGIRLTEVVNPAERFKKFK